MPLSPPFWLCLVDQQQIRFVLSTSPENPGPEASWQSTEPESILSAADLSLSETSESLSLSSEEEPNQIAFVIPPSWVGADNKIQETLFALLQNLCRRLNLKPLGFINTHEAVADHYHQNHHDDEIPSSFVLVDFHVSETYLSLINLGRIENSHTLALSHEEVGPKDVADWLGLLHDQGQSLPPKIILIGLVDASRQSQFENFPWTPIFSHLPEIGLLRLEQLIPIYLQVISQQIPSLPTPSPAPTTPLDLSPQTDNIEEVSPSQLDFSTLQDQPGPIPPPPSTPLPSIPPRPRFKLPQFTFTLSKIPFRFSRISWRFLPLVLILSPLIIFIVSWLFFFRADITIFATPYELNRQIPATLDHSNGLIQVNNQSIQLEAQPIRIQSQAEKATTGQKIVGEKAKGEITIYNAQSVPVKLAKDIVLIGPGNLQFQLTSEVNVASSSANLDMGIITMGQTKAVATAVDIGPESNIKEGTKLTFKDFSENELLARSSNPFTGGTRTQINIVSKTDIDDLTSQITADVDQNYLRLQDEQITSHPNIIWYHPKISPKIDFDRYVDENSDRISATGEAEVSLLKLPITQLLALIEQTFANEFDFSQIELDPDRIYLRFDGQQLTLTATLLPKQDPLAIRRLFTGQSTRRANEIVRSANPRFYNYNLRYSPSIPAIFPIFPLRQSNINITVKLESP